ncbi:MAG TPA: cysteine desulfurase [Gemmatimonadales bacterium]|nr:cysteine desulfurase [Gemmatimonadales bacterium]
MPSRGRAAAPTPRLRDVRDDFPILRQPSNGHRLVYLDSAATSQKPQAVIDAITAYYGGLNANVHRGGYDLAIRATDAYEEARASLASFTGAPDPSGVIFVRGTTEGINLIASSLGALRVRPGDTIVVTAMEHHSNLIPWQLVAQARGAEIVMVELTADGRIDLADFRRALEREPSVVAFTHVSNTLGTINPVAELVRLAHGAGAVVVVDGAQSAPHVPVDVKALDCDFYVLSGHKMLAPMGIGAVIGKPELLDAMPPYHGGGEMINVVRDTTATYAPLPQKFEAGTPNVEGAIGLGAAIGYLRGLGMEAIAAHERELAAYALRKLAAIEGMTIYGPMDERAGVISFTLADIHPHDLATILDHEGVAIRAGHHCTQPLMRRLNVSATARASFYVYNTEEDVDALVAALQKALTLFGLARA